MIQVNRAEQTARATNHRDSSTVPQHFSVVELCSQLVCVEPYPTGYAETRSPLIAPTATTLASLALHHRIREQPSRSDLQTQTTSKVVEAGSGLLEAVSLTCSLIVA